MSLHQVLRENVYTALLKALLAPNAGCVSWRPVRASAAAALASLLQVLISMSSLKKIFDGMLESSAHCYALGSTSLLCEVLCFKIL